MDKLLRNIIKLDEGRCGGCGICILDCPKGALRLEDGKARLVDERLCDGLGICLKCCPTAAISIERREALPFDEELVKERPLPVLDKVSSQVAAQSHDSAAFSGDEPGLYMSTRQKPEGMQDADIFWPVKLAMLTSLPEGSDVLVCADCAPPLIRNFRQDFFDKYRLITVCPKYEDIGAMVIKLADMYRIGRPASITTMRMIEPCCQGVALLSRGAQNIAGVKAQVEDIIVDIAGKRIGR